MHAKHTHNQKNDAEAEIFKFGPFHRLKSPTQDVEAMRKQLSSHQIWGRPRRDSDIPQVQAYTGPLIGDGIEFYTVVPPDTSLPPGHARWTGPREGVVVEEGFAKIECQITRVFGYKELAERDETKEEDYEEEEEAEVEAEVAA